MDVKTLKALEGSIIKWEKIVDGKGIDNGIDNCPLCKRFHLGKDCVGCPVFAKTGIYGCDRTPYDEWHKHHSIKHRDCIHCEINCKTCKKLAQKELAFLKSLLPKKEAK
jgi:hypothetical protein